MDGQVSTVYIYHPNIFYMRVTIYALLNDKDQPFYVGGTTSHVIKRLRNHLSYARLDAERTHHPTKNRKNLYIKSIGYNVKIKVLEFHDVEDAYSKLDAIRQCVHRENFWVKEYVERGFKMYNQEAKIQIQRSAFKTEKIGDVYAANII